MSVWVRLVTEREQDTIKLYSHSYDVFFAKVSPILLTVGYSPNDHYESALLLTIKKVIHDLLAPLLFIDSHKGTSEKKLTIDRGEVGELELEICFL